MSIRFKIFSKISFSTVILSFLFPFLTVSCDDTKIVETKGIEIILGRVNLVQPTKGFDSKNPFKKFKKDKIEPNNLFKNEFFDDNLLPNFYLISIIILSLIGLIFCFRSEFSFQKEVILIIAFIGVLVVSALGYNIDSIVNKNSSNAYNYSGYFQITLKSGYYIMLLGFLISYLDPLIEIFTDN
jgi:hypothetical protein